MTKIVFFCFFCILTLQNVQSQVNFPPKTTLSAFLNRENRQEIPNLKKVTSIDSAYFGVLNQKDNYFSGLKYEKVIPLFIYSESAKYSGIAPSDFTERANHFKFNSFLNVKKKNGKYNFINRDGREIFKEDFIAGEPLDSVLLVIQGENQNFSLANITGEHLTSSLFTNVVIMGEYLQVNCDTSENFIIFGNDNTSMVYFKSNLGPSSQSGLIDRNGKWIILPKYNYLQYWDKGLYIVSLNNKFGVINIKEEVCIPFEYDRIETSSKDKKLIFVKNNKYGLMDKNGKTLTKELYDDLNVADSKTLYYAFKSGNKCGLLDINCKKLFEIESDGVSFLTSSTIAQFRKEGKIGFINDRGKVIFQAIFERVDYFSGKNQFTFTENKKLGIGSYDGKILIPALYEEISQEVLNEESYFIKGKNKDNFDFYDTNCRKIASFKGDWPFIIDDKPFFRIKTSSSTFFLDDKTGLFVKER
jgi:hypothetical protein